MGNCQAAEAATVVIQHPGGKVERVYCSVSACEVMGSNPGHYVAVVVGAPPHAAAGVGAHGSSVPVRHLKLLRPDDTLHIGHVYRLISFEEVLKEFAAKKHVKLSRLLLAQQQQEEKKKKKKKKGDRVGNGWRGRAGPSTASESSSAMVEHPQPQQQVSREREEDDVHANTMGGSSIISGGRLGGAAARHGQWRPSLQSIAEAGI